MYIYIYTYIYIYMFVLRMFDKRSREVPKMSSGLKKRPLRREASEVHPGQSGSVSAR